MKLRILSPALAACLLLSACSKPEPEVREEPPAPLPKTFAFTETNTLVAASEIESIGDEKTALKADFNQDGLSDIAIIRKEGGVQNKVDIYIQKKTAPSEDTGGTASTTEAIYFKGGTIQRPTEGEITGIASRAEKRVVDIIILVTHSNKPNDWIHYRNDGASFTEVAF